MGARISMTINLHSYNIAQATVRFVVIALQEPHCARFCECTTLINQIGTWETQGGKEFGTKKPRMLARGPDSRSSPETPFVSTGAA